MARRLARLQQLNDDGQAQALERAYCARNLIHWTQTWAWTYDPRMPAPVMPFDLFPRQIELLHWIGERDRRQENGLVEKSRDTGVSFICCLYALHGWLFRPGFQCAFGSRKMEYVDAKGDPKSIFEKLRLLLSRLPGWMLPAGFREKDHSCCAKLINPANGATLTGEGGDNIGRGGRSTVYIVDEAAFLEHSALIDRALSQTTRCRIDVSTPNGPGNSFAAKRFGGHVPVFTFHWRDDPRKSAVWYEEEKRRHDPVTIAQELDIDYTASVEGICIPAAWVRAAVGLAEWARATHGVELSASGDAVAGLDVAEEGANKSAFVVRRGTIVDEAMVWGKCNTTETAWRARELARKAGVKTVYFDANAVGAGVRGTWATAEEKLPFRAQGVMTGAAPTDARWPDGRSSKEKFLNLRAELWWGLRVRCERAYEYRELGIQHALDSMISLPNDPQLIAELSQVLVQYTESGKIKIEAKSDMKRRGVASPDVADALTLAFMASGLRKLTADMFFV